MGLLRLLFIGFCGFLGWAYFTGYEVVSPKLKTASLSDSEIKSGAHPIAYKTLARDPSANAGSIIRVRGKVLQAVESGNDILLRVDVTPGAYGIWTDTLYVDYRKRVQSEPRILEKDVVQIWGEFVGIKSYTTVLGATMQIPHVVARVIEPAK